LASTLILAAALLRLAARAHALEDFQYRQGIYVRTLETTNWVLITWGELRRTDDFSKFTNWRVSQQVQYNPSSNLTIGVGYTFIQQDGFDVIANRDRETATHRAEFELIPHLQLGDEARFNCRLRFENRWIEGLGSWNPQFRARPEIVFPIHGLAPLVEIYTQNEFFYDLKRDRFTEDRLVPAGLTFQLGHHARLRLNYLLDTIHTTSRWDHLHVLQTQLLISLR
jgi:hypothetical protein